MNTDSNRNSRFFPKANLHFSPAFNRIDSTIENAQCTITIVLKYPSPVLFSNGVKNPSMLIPGLYSLLLILLHQGGITHDISEHDSS